MRFRPAIDATTGEYYLPVTERGRQLLVAVNVRLLALPVGWPEVPVACAIRRNRIESRKSPVRREIARRRPPVPGVRGAVRSAPQRS